MKDLLKLARQAIKSYLLEERKVEVNEDIRKKYSEKGASFVTLTEHGNLRGCVGSLDARQELWRDVMNNALNAAFRDSRFPPLTKDELDDIKIEISILSKPEKLDYKDEKDLLNKLDKKYGVVIKKEGRSATYLPQVWDALEDKEKFLASLCLKAGLTSDAWKEKDAEIFVYEVKKFEE